MKCKLDENLPRRATELLRQSGHDAVGVLDQVPAGTSDAEIAELVRFEARALVTLDLGFADIRAYPPNEYAGIVVLRPRRANSGAVVSLIDRLVKALEKDSPAGLLWVVDERHIRIRGSI